MIKFDKSKVRAIFLRDMVCLNIALALIEVGSKADDFNGELKVLHKNKKRKELKQLKNNLDFLKSKQQDIYSQLELKDLEAIMGLSRRFFPQFVKTADMKKTVNLEHLAIQMIMMKFKRTNIHDTVKFFTKSWGIGKINRLMMENEVTCSDVEKELATELIKKIERI